MMPERGGRLRVGHARFGRRFKCSIISRKNMFSLYKAHKSAKNTSGTLVCLNKPLSTAFAAAREHLQWRCQLPATRLVAALPSTWSHRVPAITEIEIVRSAPASCVRVSNLHNVPCGIGDNADFNHFGVLSGEA